MILDDVPEEWKTVGDIAVEIGMSERAVRTMTKRASELGNIEKKDFRIRHSDSRAARMVTHFKIKNDDSKKKAPKKAELSLPKSIEAFGISFDIVIRADLEHDNSAYGLAKFK